MVLDKKTDEELMVLYQNGTEEAFHILYQRHAGKILGFIRGKIRNEQQSLDIFQEVFVKIHNSKHLYNKSFPVLPWIFTVSRTVLIDNLRKEKVDAKISNVNLDSLPANETEELYDISPVLPHLSCLPVNQRAALEMRYVEEKTFDEIAEQLNTSALNVRQMISRGIKRIKQMMGEKP